MRNTVIYRDELAQYNNQMVPDAEWMMVKHSDGTRSRKTKLTKARAAELVEKKIGTETSRAEESGVEEAEAMELGSEQGSEDL